MVADHALGVEQKRFRRPLRAKRTRHVVIEVLEDGERHLSLQGVPRNADERILRVGVDRQELHALARVLLVQCDQRRDIEVGQRAFGADKHQHEGFLILEPVQRARPAVNVLEGEVRHSGPRRGRRELSCCRVGEPKGDGQERRE